MRGSRWPTPRVTTTQAAQTLAVLCLVALVATWIAAGPGIPEPVANAGAQRPLRLTQSAAPVVAVLGDSYTAGSEMGGNGQDSWLSVMCARLRCRDDLRFAIGGTGFVNPGPAGSTFADRLDALVASAPDVVVVAGGANDIGEAPGELGVAVAEVLDRLEAGLPGSTVVVMSPFWRSTPTPKVDEVTGLLQSAAMDRDLLFVDVSQLFAGQAGAAYIGVDGVHPTDEGHAYMARAIEPELKTVIDAKR